MKRVLLLLFACLIAGPALAQSKINGTGVLVGGVPLPQVIGGLATIASPTFTGAPAVPTATAGTATTQAASTAFVGSAVNMVSPVAPATGTATAGQTTITAPAAVPQASPWWVRVVWNGVVQRPGTDFTSDGTTTIHLAFSAVGGEAWLIEQLQRNPS